MSISLTAVLTVQVDQSVLTVRVYRGSDGHFALWSGERIDSRRIADRIVDAARRALDAVRAGTQG